MKIVLTLETNFGRTHPDNQPTRGQIASEIFSRERELEDALRHFLDKNTNASLHWFELVGIEVSKSEDE